MRKTDKRLLDEMHRLVAQFNSDILGLQPPETPQMLSGPRKSWAETALEEELEEFRQAQTVEDQADALIDLCYFALGRIFEMGIPAGASFEEVNDRNMDKRKGELSKRPGSLGFDAVKPQGWTPPNIGGLLCLSRREILATNYMGARDLPRVAIIGHAGAGKDTIGKMLDQRYGLAYRQVSELLAHTVVFDAVRRGVSFDGIPQPTRYAYVDGEACFEDRVNYRPYWFNVIRDYTAEDPARLARMIFRDMGYHVYCGIRSDVELAGAKQAGLIDFTIWVDSSDRGIPEEDEASCKVRPEDADCVIRNSGSLADLEREVDGVMLDLFREFGNQMRPALLPESNARLSLEGLK